MKMCYFQIVLKFQLRCYMVFLVVGLNHSCFQTWKQYHSQTIIYNGVRDNDQSKTEMSAVLKRWFRLTECYLRYSTPEKR